MIARIAATFSSTRPDRTSSYPLALSSTSSSSPPDTRDDSTLWLKIYSQRRDYSKTACYRRNHASGTFSSSYRSDRTGRWPRRRRCISRACTRATFRYRRRARCASAPNRVPVAARTRASPNTTASSISSFSRRTFSPIFARFSISLGRCFG